MPIVIPNGFSQVVLDFTIPAPNGDKVCSTTFGVSQIPTAQVLESICDIYEETVWVPAGTTRGRFVGGSIRDSLSTFENVRSVPGGGSGAMYPPNVSLLVKKVTNGAGRKNRGRMYPPGLVYEATYDDQGVMSPTNLGEYQDFFDDLVAGLDTLGAGMVVLHSDETAPTGVVSLAVQAVAATQRRRLR